MMPSFVEVIKYGTHVRYLKTLMHFCLALRIAKKLPMLQVQETFLYGSHI